MTETKMKCDGCGKDLDPKGDRFEFKPLRGGIAFYERSVSTGGDVALTTVMLNNFALHFCPDTNGACIGDYLLKQVAAKKEQDAKKAEAAKTAQDKLKEN
jgi:hypothetical protein